MKDKLNSFYQYLHRTGDALSQLINVMILMGKNPNESISGRAYSMQDVHRGWYFAYRVINAIFFLQEDHCEAAFLSDINRARLLLDRLQ